VIVIVAVLKIGSSTAIIRHTARKLKIVKDIAEVRLIDKRALYSEIGWGMRVGAGGLWGGFGWLWTQRRGIVQMYISRTDGFVWIERVGDRSWLITPAQPAAFVRALSSASKNEGLAR
jgi:hypothetical protein